MNSKGQVSIEYLMNYGWAFLILAIVIAAILVTGVFNPNYFLMEECYLGASFRCNAQLVSSVDAANPGAIIYLNMTNTLGYPIRLNNISFVMEDSGATAQAYDVPGAPRLNNTDSYFRSSGLFLQTPSLMPRGTTKKILVTLTYYICAEEVNPACNFDNPAYMRTVSGRIVTQVAEPA